MLEVSYYADVVGKVPLDHRSGTAGLESFDIGNGDLPPEWGVDIVVRGGFFRYGPWADRQRYIILHFFLLCSNCCTAELNFNGHSSPTPTTILSQLHFSSQEINGYGQL